MNVISSIIKSAVTLENQFNNIEEIIEKVYLQNKKVNVFVERIPFCEMRNWNFENNFSKLSHDSGKFFSIEGIRVYTNWGEINTWDQPIINQPEIGYLGLITKEFDGILYFLLQCKIEPGNVNYVQLSPTLQATKSNYTQVHKGKTPAYLRYFQNAKPKNILVDQLQSEQGSRFFKKRNRNIVIKVEEDIDVYDNFIWVTLAQIKKLICLDNFINMDTRTVLSCLPFSNFSIADDTLFNAFNDNGINADTLFVNSFLLKKRSKYTFQELIKFITQRKCEYNLDTIKIPLSSLNNWIIDNDEIRHEENKYFKVIGTRVSIDNREVISWDQPLIMPAQEGICAFICKEICGVLHLIVQTKLESGNFDILELAPTVQCLTGNYNNPNSIESVPYLSYILNVDSSSIKFDTLQSEEGGRFFREQNRNMLIIADESFDENLPVNFIWMTLYQLKLFAQFNNYINIQARSLIASIPFL
jgi:oxidase EvaA